MDGEQPHRGFAIDGSFRALEESSEGAEGARDEGGREEGARDLGVLNRREVLVGASAAVAMTLLPRAAEATSIYQPVLSACASSLSVLQGGTLNFYLPVTTGIVGPVRIEIRKVDAIGAGGLETTPHLASTILSPTPTPVSLAADVYATGCSGLPAYPVTIPAGWESGLYVALFQDSATPSPNATNFAFVVRRANAATKPQALVVMPLATLYAYNYWGGASHYAGPPGFTYSTGCGVSNSYIHAWDGLAAAHFSHQVALDRPGIGWQGGNAANGAPTSGYAVDYSDFVGAIRFLNDALGAANVDYATSVDLHTDTGLLPGYNLMISVGHDEYWSKEMRNNLENWVQYYAGNACFLGANTCWWQVRFERRDAAGTLLQANDPSKMVCYKQDGQPVGQVGYDYSKDPVYCETPVDRTRLTTHWHTPFLNRPENSMTGVSYRNGAYYSGGGNAAYNVNYPKHWAFAQPQLLDANNQPYTAGIPFALNQKFGNTAMPGVGNFTLFDVSPEWDAADLKPNVTPPETSGNDGSPLNLLPLATCQCNTNAVKPYAALPPGFATMGLFRNNGVVFHCGVLGWRYGLSPEWKTNPPNMGGDVAASQITYNVLQRLRQIGPWKFEAELHNAYFESWNGATLNDWVVTGLGTISKGAIAPPTGNHSLDVNATLGQTTITQEHTVLPPLHLERYTNYQVGVLVKAPHPGDVTLYLMSQGGHVFASCTNTQSNAWETIQATQQMNLEGPMFDAWVVMVVKGGTTAQLSDVSVFEVLSGAVFKAPPITL
jgi:hypothetical protein